DEAAALKLDENGAETIEAKPEQVGDHAAAPRILDHVGRPALLHVGARGGDEERGDALDRLALAGHAQLLAANLELALDRRGELRLSLGVVADDVGRLVQRQAGDDGVEQGARAEYVLLQEAEAGVVAGEQELDHRLALAAAALIEAYG